jgi:hypothetical protein
MATVKQQFDCRDLIPFASAGPTFTVSDSSGGSAYAISALSFAAATAGQAAAVRFKASNYGSGNLTLIIRWYAAATTGNVQWNGQIAVNTPGDAQSVLSDALATATNVTTTVNGTANGLNTSSITISNLDSLAADDEVWLVISRTNGGSDTMSGAALLLGFELTYSDT